MARFSVLLLASTIVSAALALWANREKLRAFNAETAAKAEKTKAQEQKTRAEERERTAIAAVKKFGDVVIESKELKNSPALGAVRKTLLGEPLEFFKSLRNQLQKDQGTTQESLTRLTDASFALAHITSQVGDKEAALRLYVETLGVNERLARENPKSINFEKQLADNQYAIGVLKHVTGRFSEASEFYKKAIDTRERPLWRISRRRPGSNRPRGELPKPGILFERHREP